MKKKLAEKVTAAFAAAALTFLPSCDNSGDSTEFNNELPVSVVKIQYLNFYAGGYQTTCTDFNGNGEGYVSIRINDKQKWMITGAGTVPSRGYDIPYNENENGAVCFQITAVGNDVTMIGTVHFYG